MMDLVDQMQEVPTAAEHAVRRLQRQLDDFAAQGRQWSPEAMQVSRRLEYARAQVREEATA